MNRLTRLLALSAIAPLAAMTIAAVPPGADPDSCRAIDATDEESPELCRIQTWAQCSTAQEGKVYVAAVHGNSVPVTIDAPPGSFVDDGEGCGTPPQPVGRGTTQNTQFSLDLQAFVTGNLDVLTLDLHSLVPIAADENGVATLPVRVTVDGNSLFGSDADGPVARELAVTPIASSTGASSSYRVTVVGIGLIDAEAGGGSTNREILVTVDYPQFVGVPVFGLGGVFTWVWGADEIPSGLILNPVEGEELGTITVAN